MFEVSAVSRLCVKVVVGFLTNLHALKSGDALKRLGVVLEFEDKLFSFVCWISIIDSRIFLDRDFRVIVV